MALFPIPIFFGGIHSKSGGHESRRRGEFKFLKSINRSRPDRLTAERIYAWNLRRKLAEDLFDVLDRRGRHQLIETALLENFGNRL